MKNNKKEILLWIVACIPLLFTVMIYPQLPDQIPTHWGFDGEINDYSGKATLFLLALVVPLFNGLFILLPKIDPKKASYEKFTETYFVIRVVIIFFFGFFQMISIYAGLYPESSIVSTAIPMGLGVMLLLLGNYMPKFKHNYFLGIRTPWTLANEEVWRRSHRVGGICFMLAGISMMVTPFLPSFLRGTFGFIAFLILLLIPSVYSYLAFRTLEQSH